MTRLSPRLVAASFLQYELFASWCGVATCVRGAPACCRTQLPVLVAWAVAAPSSLGHGDSAGLTAAIQGGVQLVWCLPRRLGDLHLAASGTCGGGSGGGWGVNAMQHDQGQLS